MKRIILNLLLVFFICLEVLSQPWITGEEENFYNIQKQFYTYWESRPITQGHGWKQYKRWEHMTLPRVYPNGYIKNSNQGYQEMISSISQNNVHLKNHNLIWEQVGPTSVPESHVANVHPGIGRVNFITFSKYNKDEFWIGTPSGGLWHTQTGGASWEVITDNLPNIGCTDLVIDPQNTNVMYLATGDAQGIYNTGGGKPAIYTLGVLKSIDGGDSWDTTGLNWNASEGIVINRLLMHPDSSNILLAASKDGIWRTGDYGVSWKKEKGGNIRHMEFMPENGQIVYATGFGGSFFRSIDGGKKFDKIENGLPINGQGVNRVAIGVTENAPNIVYLLCSQSGQNGFFGLYKSSDTGTTWQLQSSTPNILGYNASGNDIGGQGYYDLAIAVSPDDSNTIIAGGINTWKSTDGGKNWTLISYWVPPSSSPVIHADIHGIYYLPGSSDTIFSVNDGGIYTSYDEGDTWLDISHNLSIRQSYRVALSSSNADLICLGGQDNGTVMYDGNNWKQVLGADGGTCIIDYTNDDIVYGTIQGGMAIYRSDDGMQTIKEITPSPAGPGAWVLPLAIHTQTPEILYTGYDDVYKTSDKGDSWSRVSFGIGAVQNPILSISVSPSDGDVVFASTINSLHKTIDGGNNWVNITGSLPVNNAAVSEVAISQNDPDQIWVVFSGYSAQDKVFLSIDGGDTWDNISYNLPNIPINCITYEVSTNNTIYIGTDIGIYTKNDNAEEWTSVNEGLPNVLVNDLQISPVTGELYAATFGRGVWKSQALNANIDVNQSNAFDINLYPNPSSGIVNFNVGGHGSNTVVKLEVFNQYGQLLNTYYKKGNRFEIDLGLLKGPYYVNGYIQNHKVFSKEIFILK